jgi:hypothetical protein
MAYAQQLGWLIEDAAVPQYGGVIDKARKQTEIGTGINGGQWH